MPPITQLTDSELYKKCATLGALSLQYRKQFCGLLPEVEKRKLYHKYGMHSIYEFGAKLAGLTHETVNEVLRVHELLMDKPLLQAKLTSGEIGYTKLRPVARVATPETQKEWLEKIQTMSGKTLEMYVHEMKKSEQSPSELRAKEATFETLSMTVFRHTAAKFRVFKERLEKKMKKPLTWDDVLRAVLENQTLIQKRVLKNPRHMKRVQTGKRYIPAKVRHILEEKHHGLCAFPQCFKPAKILHHTERFSLKPEHNPETITPLCTGHERIAHHGLIAHEEQSTKQWHVRETPDSTHPKYKIDQIVQKFRMPQATMPNAP